MQRRSLSGHFRSSKDLREVINTLDKKDENGEDITNEKEKIGGNKPVPAVEVSNDSADVQDIMKDDEVTTGTLF